MNLYLADDMGILTGPVHLPVVPGLGVQIPGNGMQLSELLPEPLPGQVWALVDGEPQQVADHRGTLYEIDTGAELQYHQLGDVPNGYTKAPRPSPDYHWQAGQWVINLQSVHADAERRINADCQAAITAGFFSSALGAAHLYSSQLDDQLNLAGVVLTGLDTLYACRDIHGVRDFRPHTFAQIRQVGDDLTLFKQQLLQKANTLKQQLDQALIADDCDALEAVTWSAQS
ncbi:hypothetical protein PspR84_01740 [Pseudomonas sp. R84]|uniref:DUF4376 domain-containing protein n=1 Tax=Pseudomonas sp. R84 TaxID=1573712 RepID=UPI00131FBD83|nr:hypothetical protein [Pseudomonas sp. R84]QHC93401.1 hypothetical protein PspR84_01740 [Pseudomonas sp. R84]